MEICITDKQIPELTEMEVGDKLSLITLYEICERKESKDGLEFELKILKVAEDSGMKVSKEIKKAFGKHEEMEMKGVKDLVDSEESEEKNKEA